VVGARVLLGRVRRRVVKKARGAADPRQHEPRAACDDAERREDRNLFACRAWPHHYPPSSSYGRIIVRSRTDANGRLTKTVGRTRVTLGSVHLRSPM
jgi:hypothetical protein